MGEHEDDDEREKERDPRDEKRGEFDARAARKEFGERPERPERPPRRRRRRPDWEEPDLGDDPAMRMLLPVGQSGWAIASGYLGLISVLCIPSPFALITGILAIREMRRNPKKHGMGRAVFGIVMGTIGTISMLFMIVMMVIAQFNKR